MASLTEVQVLAYKLAGYMPFDNRIPGKYQFVRYYLSQFYIWFFYLNHLHLLICQLKTSYDLYGIDLDVFIKAVMESLIFVAPFIYKFIFMAFAKEFDSLFKTIDTEFRMQSDGGVLYDQMVQCAQRVKKYTTYWLISTTLGTLHFGLQPILDGKGLLPSMTWYPFNVMQSPAFETVYALQVVAQIHIGFVFNSVFAGCLGILYLICGQFEVLLTDVRSICYVTMEGRICSNGDNMQRYALEHPTKFNQNVIQTVKICIERHQILLSICEQALRVFNWFLLHSVCHLTLIMCAFAYMLSIISYADNKAINNVVYLGLSCVELMFLCYICDILRVKVCARKYCFAHNLCNIFIPI